MPLHEPIEAGADRSRVATRVAVLRREWPGRAARPDDDARMRVSVSFPEFRPWCARFDFLHYVDRDANAPVDEFVLVGYGLERPISIAQANGDPDDVRLPPAYSRDFVKDVHRYARIGELKLRMRHLEANDRHRRIVEPFAHRDLEELVRVCGITRGAPRQSRTCRHLRRASFDESGGTCRKHWRRG